MFDLAFANAHNIPGLEDQLEDGIIGWRHAQSLKNNRNRRNRKTKIRQKKNVVRFGKEEGGGNEERRLLL